MMLAQDAPVVALLSELVRRGVELRAKGEQLLYRPRSAVTPDLAADIATRKPELLALLSAGDPAATHYTADEYRLLTDASPDLRAAVERIKAAFPGAALVRIRKAAAAPEPLDTPAWLAPDNSDGLPKAVVALARMRDGWTPQAWRARLPQMAASCEVLQPERAAELRRAAIVMTPALVEVFEERAAIMEYDGGMSRELAEAAAVAETVRNIGNQEQLAISQVLCYSSNHGGRTKRDSESD